MSPTPCLVLAFHFVVQMERPEFQFLYYRRGIKSKETRDSLWTFYNFLVGSWFAALCWSSEDWQHSTSAPSCLSKKLYSKRKLWCLKWIILPQNESSSLISLWTCLWETYPSARTNQRVRFTRGIIVTIVKSNPSIYHKRALFIYTSTYIGSSTATILLIWSLMWYVCYVFNHSFRGRICRWKNSHLGWQTDGNFTHEWSIWSGSKRTPVSILMCLY